MNNASNNNTIVKELVDLFNNFLEKANHIQYFLHTTNLAAKAILR